MANSTFYAGRLRHRVDIQRPVEVQDPQTGEVNVTAWINIFASVPCEIAPLSAREYLASAALQSDVTGRVTIRYRTGVTAKMRCRHDDMHGTVTYYQIVGKPIRDPVQGLEWLTLPVQDGVVVDAIVDPLPILPIANADWSGANGVLRFRAGSFDISFGDGHSPAIGVMGTAVQTYFTGLGATLTGDMGTLEAGVPSGQDSSGIFAYDIAVFDSTGNDAAVIFANGAINHDFSSRSCSVVNAAGVTMYAGTIGAMEISIMFVPPMVADGEYALLVGAP